MPNSGTPGAQQQLQDHRGRQGAAQASQVSHAAGAAHRSHQDTRSRSRIAHAARRSRRPAGSHVQPERLTCTPGRTQALQDRAGRQAQPEASSVSHAAGAAHRSHQGAQPLQDYRGRQGAAEASRVSRTAGAAHRAHQARSIAPETSREKHRTGRTKTGAAAAFKTPPAQKNQRFAACGRPAQRVAWGIFARRAVRKRTRKRTQAHMRKPSRPPGRPRGSTPPPVKRRAHAASADIPPKYYFFSYTRNIQSAQAARDSCARDCARFGHTRHTQPLQAHTRPPGRSRRPAGSHVLPEAAQGTPGTRSRSRIAEAHQAQPEASRVSRAAGGRPGRTRARSSRSRLTQGRQGAAGGQQGLTCCRRPPRAHQGARSRSRADTEREVKP